MCIVGLDSNKKGKWRSTGSAHLLCFAFCLVGVAGLKRSLKEETAVLQNSYYILGVFFVFFFGVWSKKKKKKETSVNLVRSNNKQQQQQQRGLVAAQVHME